MGRARRGGGRPEATTTLQDPSKRTRRRHLIFGLVALATSTVVALTAAEVYLRAAGPDWLELRMRELTAGNAQSFGSDRPWPVEKRGGRIVRFEPGAELTVQHVEYHKTAHFDELGARVTGDGRGRTPLIPILGDSFTFGIGVEDDETFASHLARKSGRRVLNLGVPGFSLKEELNVVELMHEELGSPPLYVFVAYAGNDLYETWARRAAQPAPSGAAPKSPPWYARANALVNHHPLLRKSYLLQFSRQSLLTFLDPSRKTGMSFLFRLIRDEAFLEECIRVYSKQMERLERLGRENSFDTIFVVIPAKYQIDQEQFEAKAVYYGIDGAHLDPHAPTRALVEIYEHFGFPVIDASGCLQNSGSVATLYYVQDGHFTGAGHRAFARCLLDEDILERIELTGQQ